jgi:hypothetical protein
MKTTALLGLLLLLCLGAGCKWASLVKEPPEPQVPAVGDGWLMFDLQPLNSNEKVQRYRATYEAERKIARFEFEVISKESSDSPPIAFTTGKLISVAGSDSSVLLRNLKTTLQAKTLPVASKRVAELPFTAAILGEHQSHAANGGFFTEPSGNWTCMKIFIGKQDDPAEVFLDFNPVLRKGEFSIKDPDYGNDVLLELAKVL